MIFNVDVTLRMQHWDALTPLSFSLSVPSNPPPAVRDPDPATGPPPQLPEPLHSAIPLQPPKQATAHRADPPLSSSPPTEGNEGDAERTNKQVRHQLVLLFASFGFIHSLIYGHVPIQHSLMNHGTNERGFENDGGENNTRNACDVTTGENNS